MIITKYYDTREDGVKLYRTIDAVVDENGTPIDENGMPIKDEETNLVPTGFKIQKVGTDEIYDEAIDVEGAPFKYIETTEPIQPVEETESEEDTEPAEDPQ